jgi:hypothetical protein
MVMSRNLDQNTPFYVPRVSLFLGNKQNSTVIRAIQKKGDNQEKLKQVTLLLDLHGQVKNPVTSREFK